MPKAIRLDEPHPRGSSLDTTSRNQSATLITFAFLLLVSELLAYVAYPPAEVWKNVAFAFLFTAPIAAMARWPYFGGLSYAIVALVDSFADTTISLPTLGLYVIVAVWVSQRWIASATLVWVTVVTAWIVESPAEQQVGLALTVVLGTTVAVAIGLWIRRNRLAVSGLSAKAQKAAQRAEQTRRDITKGLHDTVARDLATLKIACDVAISNQMSSQAQSDLNLIRDHTIRAIDDLRVIVRHESALNSVSTPQAVLAQFQPLFKLRGMDLRIELSKSEKDRLPTGRDALVTGILEEACMNAFKHAAENSSVEVRQEITADRGTTLTIASALSSEADDKALIGGTGLESLGFLAKEQGATLTFGPVGEYWLVVAEIPPVLFKERSNHSNAKL